MKELKDFKDLEAEKVLINQMIMEPSIIENVYEVVKPEAFYSQVYKTCYNHLLNLQRKCTPIDEVSFFTEAKDIPIEVFNDVTSSASTSANWNYFATLIKNCYLARNVKNLLSISLEELSENNGDTTINKLLQDLSMIFVNATSCQVHSIPDLVKSCIKKIDEAVTKQSLYTGYPTGLKNLDEIIMGIQNEYIIIGARPSLGKTALGEQIALNLAGVFNENNDSGIKTGFIELEMSADQLIERAISNITHIGMNRLRSGLLTKDQLLRIVLKAEKLSQNTNFIPITCNSRNIEDIVACARREVRNNGMKALFIDHIGLIHSRGIYRDSWQGVREVSNTLQQLQRELNIPIIVLSQVGRESEGKQNTLAALRGSGAIEEDADEVIFIERDRQKDVFEQSIPAKLNVVKNRNGTCGTAFVEFLPKEVVFIDAKQNRENQ